MATNGRVRIWNDEAGWGVIDSDETPGGSWTHYSAVAIGGYRRLAVGASVDFEWEQAEQDGCDYRTTLAWPAGASPVDPAPDAIGDESAYGSSLTLTRADGTAVTSHGDRLPTSDDRRSSD